MGNTTEKTDTLPGEVSDLAVRLRALSRAEHSDFSIGDEAAAAPDLLDALQEFAVQHQCGCGHPHCNDCARDAMADAALTKARAVPPNNQGNRRA